MGIWSESFPSALTAPKAGVKISRSVVLAYSQGYAAITLCPHFSTSSEPLTHQQTCPSPLPQPWTPLTRSQSVDPAARDVSAQWHHGVCGLLRPISSTEQRGQPRVAGSALPVRGPEGLPALPGLALLGGAVPCDPDVHVPLASPSGAGWVLEKGLSASSVRFLTEPLLFTVELGV